MVIQQLVNVDRCMGLVGADARQRAFSYEPDEDGLRDFGKQLSTNTGQHPVDRK